MISELLTKNADDGNGTGENGTSETSSSAESSNMFDKSKSNADCAKVSGLSSTRRASFSEAKIGDGQGRKRSNEPIKRKNQEKQRKSAGDEVIEQRMAALAKENDALKCQLEEQIRLNSVIVANPTLASLSTTINNSNLPRIMFAGGSEEQSSSSLGNIMPNFAASFGSGESKFCTLQKSERSAFSVIRSGNPTQPPLLQSAQRSDQTELNQAMSSNAFVQPQQNKLAAQLAPFSLFPHVQFPPPARTALTVSTVCQPTVSDNHQHTVVEGRQHKDDVNSPIVETGKQQQHQRQLKKQLIPVHPNRSFSNVAGFGTLADTSSDDCLPFNFKDNLRPALSTMATDVQNVNDESPLDFSKSGQQQHKTAATANLNLALPDSVVGELFIKADCQTQQKKQPPPSSNCSTSAASDRWTPVIQQHKHGPTQLQQITTASYNAKQLTNPRKTVLEVAEASSSSSDVLLHLHPQSSNFTPSPHPSLPNFSSSILQLLMLRGRLGLDENGNYGLSPEQLINQPTFNEPITQLATASSSSSSEQQQKLDGNTAPSSSSMLGTLLSIPPNKRRTSPTVPASRTEFCSGLALTSIKKCDESEHIAKESEHSKSMHSSSSLTSNNDKHSSNLNSDSEQSSSGGQHSPNSSHTSHSHTSDSPPSTLPGAGSTVTTVCGSDRTRRGSSSPNSGCSGDDSSLLLADKSGNGGEAGDEMGGRPTNSRSSPPAATTTSLTPMRLKMRNNDELERYMDRRRRNNEAAKRCRANRRAVFEYRSRKAQLLEAENGELRQEMVKLNAELEQLKALIAAKAAAARLSMSTG
uniref:BZIP domain-containing protein n=1 Tax=Globodera rostochiensis TaxID=31243 RepID=A0A914HYR0_GLORO